MGAALAPTPGGVIIRRITNPPDLREAWNTPLIEEDVPWTITEEIGDMQMSKTRADGLFYEDDTPKRVLSVSFDSRGFARAVQNMDGQRAYWYDIAQNFRFPRDIALAGWKTRAERIMRWREWLTVYGQLVSGQVNLRFQNSFIDR